MILIWLGQHDYICYFPLCPKAADFRLSIWELEPRQIPSSHIWHLRVPCAAVLGSVVQEVWPLREGPMAYEEVGSGKRKLDENERQRASASAQYDGESVSESRYQKSPKQGVGREKHRTWFVSYDK
ncbi:hypothetical protein TNCV_4707471 [Trichonephila clavipes]|nr:hypothetical protein TNCV_4707471 [Trichonephila clavipes]